MTVKNYQRVLKFLSVSIKHFIREFWTTSDLMTHKIEQFIFSIWNVRQSNYLQNFARNWFDFTSKFYKLFNFCWFSIGTFLNLSDNLHHPLSPIKPHKKYLSIYIHKLLKLPGLDPNLLSLKTLAMSLFIVTRFCNKSSLSTNNTAHFRYIF